MNAGTAPDPGLRLAGARRVIAERMMHSLATSAQLSFHADVDVTDLLARRAGWKASGRSIGIEDCVVAAYARTLVDHPASNGTIEGDVVRHCQAVHIAVAVSAGGSLMTPVIRDVQTLGLDEIAARRAEIVARARDGALTTSEMKGGTATISNLGLTAVRHFTPILNAGQLTLVGVGRIEPRLARAADGAIVDRQSIGLSLTVDHRVIDGDPAGRFLSDLGECLAGLHD